MTIYSGFSHLKWWFSIVMLVYQRVYDFWGSGNCMWTAFCWIHPVNGKPPIWIICINLHGGLNQQKTQPADRHRWVNIGYELVLRNLLRHVHSAAKNAMSIWDFVGIEDSAWSIHDLRQNSWDPGVVALPGLQRKHRVKVGQLDRLWSKLLGGEDSWWTHQL